MLFVNAASLANDVFQREIDGLFLRRFRMFVTIWQVSTSCRNPAALLAAGCCIAPKTLYCRLSIRDIVKFKGGCGNCRDSGRAQSVCRNEGLNRREMSGLKSML